MLKEIAKTGKGAKKLIVCQTAARPPQPAEASRERSSTESTGRANESVNHALVEQPWFIHQTWLPVSLEIKDTEVRAYRTDPVQVRSCPIILNNTDINGFIAS
ncbi:hypothetical protein ABFS83_10G135600 [Erythranthe nasuta]